jgi:Asp-tRNA(Asn)/Glu-tRNA(Gln) amidotransferase C subunit
MAVTIDDVRAMAALARLGVDEATARALSPSSSTAILEHMEQLGKVDTTASSPKVSVRPPRLCAMTS